MAESHANWSTKRRELLAWFRTNAPSLAGAYEGAVVMLLDETFPGRLHFIAHAVRDIADRLIFVLDQDLPESRAQYDNHLDRIEPLWIDPVAVSGESDDSSPESVTIGSKVASLINTLVTDHRERRERPSKYELLFRHLMRNEPLTASANRRLAQDFKRVHKWFVACAHLRRDTSAALIEESELQLLFASFEGMIHSFVGDFFTGTAELDEILRQTNA